MKDFLKNVLATIIGIFLFGSLIGFFGLISLIGMISSKSAGTTLQDNSVLVLKLQGIINEQASDNFIGQITGHQINQIGMNEMMSAIKKAKNDKHIQGIYLESGFLSADWATVQEIRGALQDFRKSGKWIIAYGERFNQPTYYISTAANKVYLNPEGMIDWHGIAAQPEYYKDLFAKFGVRFQIFKVGKYKSYTETFTEDKMSDANREQMSRIINGLWSEVCTQVSQSRHISTSQLNQYADEIVSLDGGKSLLKKNFVDGLLYADEIKSVVKKRLGLEDDDMIHQVSVAEMNKAIINEDKGDKIALYYCEGSIIDKANSLNNNEPQIVASKVCKDLEDMANDDRIKAVVLRINSGGGDAYASEQIWHYVKKLNAQKPVVVSMSGMAASGAYYMSMGARWIVAQPTTETGSIGIFAAIPDFSGLMTQKLGIKFDEIGTNKNSTFSMNNPIPMARPYNEDEAKALQRYVDRGYDLFCQRVADGRKLSVNQVHEVAQGHVFLGTDALKLKLVDQLGSMDDAIQKAASFAKLKNYYTVDYSQPTNWIDQLFGITEDSNSLDEQLRLALGEYYTPFMMLRNIKQHEVLQARIPYILNLY